MITLGFTFEKTGKTRGAIIDKVFYKFSRRTPLFQIVFNTIACCLFFSFFCLVALFNKNNNKKKAYAT
jgi:hypothetical protein